MISDFMLLLPIVIRGLEPVDAYMRITKTVRPAAQNLSMATPVKPADDG
jgi:hypothetical protein